MSYEWSYSEEGYGNRVIFYDNDINIYVEDDNKAHLYETIFERMFKDEYMIQSIFPMGGKPKVLKEYIRVGSYEEKNGKRIPNLFLLDGDFDRYLGYEKATKEDYTDSLDDDNKLTNFITGKMLDSQSVVYLESYNIENYYIDEQAVIAYVKGKLGQTKEVTRATLMFSEWKEQIVAEATDLFLAFCFVQKYLNKYGSEYNGQKSGLSVKNVSDSKRYIDHKVGCAVNSGELEKFKSNIIGVLNSERPELDYYNEIEKIKSEYESVNGNDYYNLICGKFLLRSLTRHIENKSNKTLDYNDFVWFLINMFDLKKLDYLKEKIQILVRDRK